MRLYSESRRNDSVIMYDALTNAGSALWASKFNGDLIGSRLDHSGFNSFTVRLINNTLNHNRISQSVNYTTLSIPLGTSVQSKQDLSLRFLAL